MKLIIAIVTDEDAGKVLTELNRAGFSVTKLATTGGFLRAGNVTMLIGTDEDKVDDAIKIIAEKSHKRKQFATPPMPISSRSAYTPYPIEIEVGGATVFVMDIERFEKL